MSAKYALINAEKANYPVTRMCAWLAVSRSGFYDWGRATPTAAARRRTTLRTLISAVFESSRGTYGARRVAAVLRDSGQVVSTRLVGELMAELDLVACQPRPWRRTTVPAEGTNRPDLLARDFSAAVPGAKLVGDITYVRTWTGWLYVATVIDCATRKVVGWSMADHLRTSLVIDALSMAAGTGRLRPGCVFHSDRGSQYTSAEFAAVLAARGLSGSLGRTGICWDCETAGCRPAA